MDDKTSDPNTVPEKPMDTALSAGANNVISPTDILQRNIDMRSGNLVVRNQTGKVIELGIQPDGSYGLNLFNPANGLLTAVFNEQSDGAAAMKFLNSNGVTVSQFGQLASGKSSLIFYNSAGNTVAQFGQQTDDSIALKFFDSSGVGLAQFGQYPGGSLALKVAKAGIEVSTAANDQLVFNSAQNMFKIVATGTLTVTGFTTTAVGVANKFRSTDSGNAVFTHNLGYVPASHVFILNTYGAGAGSYSPAPSTTMLSGGTQTGTWATYNVLITSTTLTINITGMGASTATNDVTLTFPDTTFKYYLLQETAA